MSSSKIQILNDKIRQFLKKFYLNKLCKGVVFFVIILLATFIAFSLFEYFSYSNTVVRSILFYSFIALSLITAIAYIIIPALKIAGLGKQLTNEEIAHIVGKHFHQIDDINSQVVINRLFCRTHIIDIFSDCKNTIF